MVGDAGIVAIRLWELAMIGTWVAGVWLVRRYGATPFLVGLYAGGSVTAFWDWLLSDRWFFNMNTDTRFVHLFTLDGIVEPLWAGFSYGFFFGICAVVVVRHRAWLDRRLGSWQYVVVPLVLGASDFVIEGISVGWLDLYRFQYRSAFLLFGVPYTNLLFIAVTQAVLLFIARRAAELCERAGYHVAGPALPVDAERSSERNGEGAVALRTRTLAPVATRPWTPFWVAVGIPSVGLYAGMVVNAFVLKALNPF
jgi:hypothetical protein